MPIPLKFLEVKFTDAELRAGRRMGRHLGVGLVALCIPFTLSAIILASGNYLSGLVEVDPGSILFRLWPSNQIYLRQFAGWRYSGSDVRWFFTVVSCSNLVWLLFLGWKFMFELLRSDVAFPSGNTPGTTQAIFRFLGAACFILVLSPLVIFAGFETPDRFIPPGLSLGQSIAVGAFKVVMVVMTIFYVAVTYVFEFGGLAIRYLLSKKVGWFLADS